jgi:hypothetical protein
MPRRKRESVFLTTATPQSSSFTIAGTKFIDICEWCFQFDDDQPIVFATGSKKDFASDPKISFTLTNRTDSTMTFFDDKTGKKLKIYSREKINN